MMRELKCKILMHNGQPIDEYLLNRGVYVKTDGLPILHPQSETIQSLVQRGEMMKDIKGNNFIDQEYFDNLQVCELVDVILLVPKN